MEPTEDKGSIEDPPSQEEENFSFNMVELRKRVELDVPRILSATLVDTGETKSPKEAEDLLKAFQDFKANSVTIGALIDLASDFKVQIASKGVVPAAYSQGDTDKDLSLDTIFADFDKADIRIGNHQAVTQQLKEDNQKALLELERVVAEL